MSKTITFGQCAGMSFFFYTRMQVHATLINPNCAKIRRLLHILAQYQISLPLELGQPVHDLVVSSNIILMFGLKFVNAQFALVPIEYRSVAHTLSSLDL